jgi:hypothetical protein
MASGEPRQSGRIARVRHVLPRHKAANWVDPGRGRKSTRPGANGVVELSPLEFLDRLADLVPPPRKHRHRYHGVFAPNHRPRKAVTALANGNVGKRSEDTTGGHAVTRVQPHHDLRRAFGERWASLVMPAHLQQLMRHESIATTLRYYVGANVDRTNDICWEAYGRQDASRSSQREAVTSQALASEENQQNFQQASAKPYSRP